MLFSLSSCDSGGDGDEACEPSDQPATVTVDNRTGGLVEAITATPCEGGAEQELTLPEGGIAFPEQATVELPAPGCWLLHWNGNGCTNDPPYRTANDVCGGESYAWQISIDGRVCENGW